MKIAICFGGQIRTGVLTVDNIKRFIGNLLPFCDFFLHTWDLDYQNPLAGESWEHYASAYKNTSLISLSDANMIKLIKEYNFKSILIDNYWKTLEDNTAIYSAHIKPSKNAWWHPDFYSWHKSVELKKQYEIINNINYDYVVKLRPDIIFSEEIKLSNLLEHAKENTFCVNQVYTDDSGTSIDHILALSNSLVANKLNSWWEYIITSGEYLNDTPTSIKFHNYVVDNNIRPVNLELYYLSNMYKVGLLRPECNIFDPIIEFEKCVECDRLHYHTEQVAPNISEEELLKLAKSTKQKREFLPNKLKKYENSDLL
jgi:hypothetical protein